MKPLFIVNPKSGGGRTGEVFESLRGPIERIVGGIDVAFTEGPRHASDIAEEAADIVAYYAWRRFEESER